MKPIRSLLAALLALAAGQADAACQMTKAATLHVSVENNRILVPGSINGTPVRFLLATDIESLILPLAAHDMGLLHMTGARHEPIIYAEEFSATSSSGPVRVSDLVVDGLKVGEWVMHVIGRRQNFGSPSDVAVLGRDFLRAFDVEFNLAASEVNLFRDEGCETTNLAYWTSHYNQLDMERHLRSVRVQATVNGHSVPADINSGNPYTALDVDTAHQLRLGGDIALPPSHDFLEDRPIETSQRMADSIGLDQETVRPAALRVRKLTSPPPMFGPATYWDSETGYARPEVEFLLGDHFRQRGADLSLGVDFIRSHRILIAYSQYRVYFSYVPGEPFLAKVKP